VTGSPRINLTSLPCGLRLGQLGNFICFLFLIQEARHLLFLFNLSPYVSPLSSLGCRYTGFGIPVPHRPVEDLAYGVAKFIQKGGSFVNYYMVTSMICALQLRLITKLLIE